MIIYEWVFEKMIGEDIEECEYTNNLTESNYIPNEVDTINLCVALCRRQLDRHGDELDREYAYVIVEKGIPVLPCNCDKFKIPKKYLNEFARWVRPLTDADKLMLNPKFRSKVNRHLAVHKIEVVTKIKQLIMQSKGIEVINGRKYIDATILNDIFEIVENCDLDWE